MNNKNKGITLIALIVTIVVLIILAGIVLNIALGQNGIFSKTKLSADAYVNSAANEAEELRKAENIIDGLFNNGATTEEDEYVDEDLIDSYNGLATESEVVPQIFLYEILTPAVGSTEGVDGVTKLADTSDTLKIAANTSKMGTAKITAINYDYMFRNLSEYTSFTDTTGARYDQFAGSTRVGSGYDNTDTVESHAKFKKEVQDNYSKIVLPATITLDSNGNYDPNGTKYKVTGVENFGYCGDLTIEDIPADALRKNVNEVVLPNTLNYISHHFLFRF